ncbi:MAG: HDOD domain-containing protein [Acidobacteriia bacterium]|nr:HDOD domain-containing protein [Terriglobia bacterium]
MTSLNRELILKKLAKADRLPSLPAVVGPLLQYLRQPIDSLQINEVTRLISQDESLTAQCLHLANSPLFGFRGTVETVRGAVLNLGMRRMQEIATSCCLINLTPKDCPMDPTVLWEHALGVALASRYFARAVAFPDPDKAYLAGLLHDFGVVMSLWVAPKEFAQAFTQATSGHIPLIEAEQEILGISHPEVGRLLGEKWHMPPDLVQVIAFHHDVEKATAHRALVALIALVDLLCRMSAVGYGYPEDRQVDFCQEPAFRVLLAECPTLTMFDWERFTFEMEAYLVEVQRLVNLVYRRS